VIAVLKILRGMRYVVWTLSAVARSACAADASSPMNKDIDWEFGDADTHSLGNSSGEHMDGTRSQSEPDNELKEAENLQSATYESNTDLFDGDEESDEETDERRRQQHCRWH